MDSNYLEVRNKMLLVSNELRKVLDRSANTSFEENLVYCKVENLLEKISSIADDINHFALPTKTGTLRKMDNGRFELVSATGKQITYFSCGSLIECQVKYDDEMQWFAGRVEYRDGGYYFYGVNKPFLYNGMPARIRE